MSRKSFKPSRRYLSKMYLNMFLVALAIAIFSVFMGWLIGRDEGPGVGRNISLVMLGINLAWWLVGMILAGAYYRSLRYEIQDDEIIVYVGIWTKSIKHVPYRTVTNIATKRDIFDRWFFGIGSLNIQTAGMSGTTGAEEQLVGLPNVHDVYEIVVAELRRFRGGMSPTAAEAEGRTTGEKGRLLNEMLSELRKIRQSLQK